METQRLGTTFPAAFAIRMPPHTLRHTTGRSIQKPACREG